MTRGEIVQEVAWKYLGKPYIWGGDDPDGFDCSGLVIECLKSVGVLPRKGDWSADSLFSLFKLRGDVIDESLASPGDLVFWDNESGMKVHVEIVIGNGLSIGASGGGSWATDPKIALERSAYVKVRPYSTRGGAMSFVNPY